MGLKTLPIAYCQLPIYSVRSVKLAAICNRQWEMTYG
jgi:hypothetical protein